MKDLLKSWKFWTAVVAVILLIVAVVLYFVSEKFCYAASGLLIGALAGFIGGFFVGKKNVNKPAAAPQRRAWPTNKPAE